MNLYFKISILCLVFVPFLMLAQNEQAVQIQPGCGQTGHRIIRARHYQIYIADSVFKQYAILKRPDTNKQTFRLNSLRRSSCLVRIFKNAPQSCCVYDRRHGTWLTGIRIVESKRRVREVVTRYALTETLYFNKNKIATLKHRPLHCYPPNF